MNAREQEKAQAAERRRQEDIRDTVIEGIGELLFRRTRRGSKPEDQLADIHVDSSADILFIARWVEAEFDTELTAVDFDFSEIQTVEQLAAAIASRFSTPVAP